MKRSFNESLVNYSHRGERFLHGRYGFDGDRYPSKVRMEHSKNPTIIDKNFIRGWDELWQKEKGLPTLEEELLKLIRYKLLPIYPASSENTKRMSLDELISAYNIDEYSLDVYTNVAKRSLEKKLKSLEA